MTRLLFLALLSSPLFAADPDPSKLLPTPEQTAKANAAATRLGSEIYLEREKATRELEALGRLALPVIDRLLAETGDAEVRSRCEALRPAMAVEDLRARLDAFNADSDGKYDHKLTGWDKFAKAAGKSQAARKLFSEMYESTSNARLLAATEGEKGGLAAAVVQRRAELYNRLYNRERFVGPNGMITMVQKTPPSMPEVATLLFAEGVLGGGSTARAQAYVVQSLLLQSPTGDIIRDPAKGEVLRKLVAIWCETRSDSLEIYYAMNLANQLNIKEASPVKLALKLIGTQNATPLYKAIAITTVARVGGKDNLPDLLKLFDDKTVFQTVVFNAGGGNERIEIQIRDLALAMAILVQEEKAEDYGFATTRATTGTAAQFTYSLYRFQNDEKRQAAFKKWNENHPVKK